MYSCFFFSSRRRHTRWTGDWSSDVCSSDLGRGLVSSRCKPCGCGGHAQVQQGGAVEHGRIIETDRGRHAVAELRGVLDVVDAGHVVRTAHQVRVVVARVAVPGRREGRSRLTEGETSELDEHHFNRDVTATRAGEPIRSEGSKCRRVVGVSTEVVELEVGLTEGADNPAFGGGTGINRQRHTRTGNEVIAETVLL